ncbi:MAG: hypothetical protein FWG83_02360 [Oscillospiraceae bacterium]|nr:hypothetical protein [Oscillospiraceae bacterium]
MKSLKKSVLSLCAGLIALSLGINAIAVPYSHGKAIGDYDEEGYITGYYSLLTVFGSDENGERLAIGLSANYSPFYSTTDYVNDIYEITSYRCGNADDTALFDPAIPIGVFKSNNCAIYRVFGSELQLPERATEFSVGDSVKIYSYTFGGIIGYEYSAKITAVDGGYLYYTSSDLQFSEAGYSNSDYLAPVYTQDNELIGVIISESRIMTIAQIEELMDSGDYVPLSYEKYEKSGTSGRIDDDYSEFSIPRSGFSLTFMFLMFSRVVLFEAFKAWFFRA